MTPDFAAAAEATWPPLATRALGPVTLRDGAGGGRRVSAATVAPGWKDAYLDPAIAAMGQPLFCVTADARLDEGLAARGFVVEDPVVAMVATCDLPPPAREVDAGWPPDAARLALWQALGIGPGRIAAMFRVAGPRTALGCDAGAGFGGAGFVACHGDWAMLHALVVTPALRRQGIGLCLVRAAAAFGRTQGAGRIGLLVTEANRGAVALYTRAGFVAAGGYHYRRGPAP